MNFNGMENFSVKEIVEKIDTRTEKIEEKVSKLEKLVWGIGVSLLLFGIQNFPDIGKVLALVK